MEDVEDTKYPWKCLIEFTSFIDRHGQDFSNILSLEFHIQRFLVIPCSTTSFTLYIDIRKEVHLDLLHPTSFTNITSSSFRIEGESPWTISSFLRLMRSCEYFTDEGEYSCICSNIRMWGLPYRCLIDDDRFIDIFESFDCSVLPDSDSTSMEVIHDLI